MENPASFLLTAIDGAIVCAILESARPFRNTGRIVNR
jgi:hypothetical protein